MTRRTPRRHKPIARLLLLPMLLLGTVVPLTQACAAEPVKVGVFSYRPKHQTLAQWQPLADALKQAMPERDFAIEALAYHELEKAVATRQLEFVLTNPGHYVLLAKHSGLSAPLATLATDDQGKAVTVSGGVIFCRAVRSDINNLADLRGKTISASAIRSVTGYQAQAYELKRHGILLPQDAKLLVTQPPHTNVVAAVLSGRADAGFAPTGALENMARRGDLDMAQVKILNRQNFSGFPAQSSTRLYPGWSFSALPHVDENLTRHVVSALFTLEDNTAPAKAMGIHGFTVPADYTVVSDMLRELRLPPFDAVPEFTPHDVWLQYRWQIATLLLAGGLILSLGLRVLIGNRKLKALQIQMANQLAFTGAVIDAEANGLSVCHGIAEAPYVRFTIWNASMEKLTGYSMEEINRLGWYQTVYADPEVQEQARLRMERMRQGDHLRGEVWAITRKDGERRIVQINTTTVTEGAEGAHVLAVMQDISERKQAEQILWEKTQLLDSIFENIPSMIFLKRASDLRFELFNKAGEALVGHNRDELLGRNDYDFFPKEQADFFTAKDRATLQQAGIVDIPEEPIETPHGTRILHTRKLTLRDEQGQPIYLLGISEDITEQKIMEKARISAETQFHMVFDNASDPIVIHDMLGHILEVNKTMCDRLGYSREELLHLSCHDINAPETADKFPSRMEVLMAQGQVSFESVHLARDGWRTPVEINARLIDYVGKPATLNIVRDITERKEFEEELKRSNAELEQFSYAVSHDMRQPLRMVSSYLQLIEMELADQLDSEKRGYFEFAIEGAKRIDQMLVELLEYSRIGRLGEPLTLTDSRALLDEALQYLQPAIAEAQARLNITGEWPRILICHDEILRLIQNLVENAVKFRVAGRVPEITIGSEIVANEWHLHIADNGIGIIPDQIKRLFQVFQRLQLRTAYEGSGVGLALCRKIAEHHKGRIWAESEGEGKGSRFCVALPVPQEKA